MKTIACTLQPAGINQRMATGAELSARGLIASERTSLGYKLRFDSDLKGDLEDLIAAESRCCPFMEFRLIEGADDLTLEVAAPETGRPLIAELFSLDEVPRNEP